MAYLRPLALLPGLALALACQTNTVDVGSDATSTGPGPDGSSTGGTGSPPGTASAVPTATATITATDTDSVDESTTAPGNDTDVMPPPPIHLLIAISTNVDPGHPLQAIATAEYGPGTIDITMQWLSLDPGSTTMPREPVGEVIEYVGIPTNDDGSFLWEVGELMIPGAANPITGSDILLEAEADVLAIGMPYCGFVMGDVLSPIQVPLDGSTLAMTEIPDPATLPEEFPVACP